MSPTALETAFVQENDPLAMYPAAILAVESLETQTLQQQALRVARPQVLARVSAHLVMYKVASLVEAL